MTWHIGCSWVGHQLEDDCPCLKAPCGLVMLELGESLAACPHHALSAARTMRQGHLSDDCPGKES